ncbi:MAG: glycerate kinase [Oscillospiraceae bacterium]|nr:glycerate kinase [Oscillospiraceae bacterium]
MKIILAFDSFKETLTASEVCDIAAQTLGELCREAEGVKLPLADGGEGMAGAWQAACGGVFHTARVSGPDGQPCGARFLMLGDGTAVIEMASCAGLELARGRMARLRPAGMTTRGVGELMLAAKEAGARAILLGLGGSATNDAGCGMAHALGWRFLDEEGNGFCPVGGTLADVARILPPEEPFPLPVTAACDVDNPLCGPHGAAHVFSPQKGADKSKTVFLERNMREFAARHLPKALSLAPGAGAAGGLGAGVLFFLGGELRSGIELLLDRLDFDALLEDADFVFTGEGRMDAQTLRGKAPLGVLLRARARNIPVAGICGCLGEGADLLYQAGFAGLFPAVREERPIGELRRSCRADLAKAVKEAIRSLTFFADQL